jgi:hypothetical protein
MECPGTKPVVAKAQGTENEILKWFWATSLLSFSPCVPSFTLCCRLLLQQNSTWLHITHLPGDIPGTHFCLRLSWPQGHSATRRIMSIPMKLLGIKPATFRLVVQCHNRATAYPLLTIYTDKIVLVDPLHSFLHSVIKYSSVFSLTLFWGTHPYDRQTASVDYYSFIYETVTLNYVPLSVLH